MIWAILAALGVPLWLCAMGILALVFRDRSLRKRFGDVPVRVMPPGKKRWVRGHAIWVSDVFAWRGSPAAWDEDLWQVSCIEERAPTDREHGKLRRLDDPLVASMTVDDGKTLLVATRANHRDGLLGPFRTRAPAAAPLQHRRA